MEQLENPRRRAEPDANILVPLTYQVVHKKKELENVVTLELARENGEKKLTIQSGQFNMLYIFGVGEVPISLSGHPKEAPERIIHTIRAVGAVTEALCQLKTGELLGVRGPFGSLWPVKPSFGHDLLLIAGGLGLAPLRPVLHEVLENRDQFGRVILIYGTRTPNDILFQKELMKWKGRFDLEVHVTVDHGTRDWRGNVGVVPALVSRLGISPFDTVAMICGPEIMMRFTIQELHKSGMTNDQIFISMERNMRCAAGFCGHCQFGPVFVCKDGPVFKLTSINHFFWIREF